MWLFPDRAEHPPVEFSQVIDKVVNGIFLSKVNKKNTHLQANVLCVIFQSTCPIQAQAQGFARELSSQFPTLWTNRGTPMFMTCSSICTDRLCVEFGILSTHDISTFGSRRRPLYTTYTKNVFTHQNTTHYPWTWNPGCSLQVTGVSIQ